MAHWDLQPVLIGVAIALFVLPPIERRYVAKYHNNGGHLPPEERLTGMMIGKLFRKTPGLHFLIVLLSGAPMIPISLFILGWTAPPYVSPGPGTWVGPCSAGIPFGCGMTLCCQWFSGLDLLWLILITLHLQISL